MTEQRRSLITKSRGRIGVRCGAALLAAWAMLAPAKRVAAQPMPQPAPQAPQIDPAQAELWDVIETTDGNVFKGVIVQQTRTANGVDYKIVLPSGGGTLTIPNDKIKQITKEPNPMRAQPAAPAYAQPTSAQPPPGYAAPAQPYGAPAPEQHHADIPPPVAQEGWRLGIQFGPYFPMSDLSNSSTTGIGGRVHVGYEFMFGRFGIKPNLAFELARFGFDDKNNTGIDGGTLYWGVQPGVEAAVHLGMFAPYAGVTFGFDHYGVTGDLSDAIIQQEGAKTTSGNGFGFGLLFGMNVVVIPNFSFGAAAEIHPGFTSIDFGNGLKSASMGHAGILFAASYLF